MISGIGEPGEWNGYHFKSPSVLDVGDFLLVAYEGWSEPTIASGIGLMIGIERWIGTEQPVVLFNIGNGYSQDLQLANHGAGELMIYAIDVSNPGFQMDLPVFPYILKSSEQLSIPIQYTRTSESGSVPGIVTVHSNSMIDPLLTIYLVAY